MSDTLDQILIRDLLVQGILGVLDHERTTPQPILINLTLFVDLRPAGASDQLADSVSYSAVADKVRQHAASAARLTVEALAADIARLCLAEPGVLKVRVRVEKTAAVPQARTVGVEIERIPGDFA